MRDFWRAQANVADFASRFTGSSDLYQSDGRTPSASINFVTAHDGFTLRDLVSYNDKHNEANGENNEDGTNDNLSRNWGAEGPTDDPAILDARDRAMRNFIATLAFSQGVPMISHGDEIARTQDGNNNTYCQDNDLTWVHWKLDDRKRGLLDFTRQVFSIRAENPVLRRRTFFRGQVIDHPGLKDLTWLRADGAELTEPDWEDANARSLGMLINGDATDETDDRGEPIKGDTMLLLINGGEGDLEFVLPGGPGWSALIDTAGAPQPPGGGDRYALRANSLALLRLTP
jgi:glycogen operon protein